MPERKKKEGKLVPEFYELKCKQLMNKKTWDLPLIERKKDINEVLSILCGRSHVWVVEDMESKELVGVITEHDILSTLAPPKLPPYIFGIPDIRSFHYGTAKIAEDIMSKKPITCDPEDKVLDALLKMIRCGIRRLPIVKDKKIIGELTLHHLIIKYYAATQYHSIVEE
ncbi:MAG: CBS domain-containing protein [Candidatus Thermoplasmatota archaeon]|nr:CBS domain-containing protein [Candidatus Thermoplasmatota archaeon]